MMSCNTKESHTEIVDRVDNDVCLLPYRLTQSSPFHRPLMYMTPLTQAPFADLVLPASTSIPNNCLFASMTFTVHKPAPLTTSPLISVTEVALSSNQYPPPT
eukprot:TRINITY_DN5155_c0_g4_i2.p1 TRINITY_DN5155_c0_g4~~TRINITY_DN5155_c0_g4_i2.p1  ORF type:complete len:102 (+),score=16.46 TRINITY_DN5155_c0_g4_i2:326-631(+)